MRQRPDKLDCHACCTFMVACLVKTPGLGPVLSGASAADADSPAGECRYKAGLASEAGLDVSSVVLTSQQAGSIILGTALDFPSNSTSYAALAATLEAFLETSPNAVFASDSTFASQYGSVTFSSFDSVGLDFSVLQLLQSDSAQLEGSIVAPSTAPGVYALSSTLSPIEAGDMARIESSYGTYIPVNGYSPPPPPPSPPPPGSPPPPPPASTATATATPTPTATSSAVGD